MLKGKSALVTGSTSGIGEGIAEAFAVRLQHRAQRLRQTGRDRRDAPAPARTHGVQVRHDGADLSDAAAIETMLTRSIGEFGGIDILVNDAGIRHVALIEEFRVAKWNAIIAVNLVAAFHTIRHTLPGMKRRGCGRIVNVGSAHALVASPFKSAYVAARHGIAGLTKTVALEAASIASPSAPSAPAMC
jgi:3-hydroxybutyrate dehydrogenase